MDELWQGQFEALPTAIKTLTIEEACNKAKPLFEMTPSIFKGIDFSAPGYILHTDTQSEWQLIWRKAGMAYIDRFTKGQPASSGLQMLYVGTDSDLRKTWGEFSKKLEQAMEKPPFYTTEHINLTEGGRLSIGLIEKEANKIDTIFGEGTSNTIVEKLNLQSTEKAQVRKELKNKP